MHNAAGKTVVLLKYNSDIYATPILAASLRLQYASRVRHTIACDQSFVPSLFTPSVAVRTKPELLCTSVNSSD